MAKYSKESIARKEHFERTGRWPETTAQAKRREAKERDVAENGPTEPAHPAVSPQLSSAPKIEKENQIAKVVRIWHENNPGFR